MVKVINHKFLAFISLLLLFCLGCEDLNVDLNETEYKDAIKIGVVGDVSVLREQVENIFFGAKLASEEINDFGGIEIDGKHHDIELIFKNSAGSPDEGIKAANELIEEGAQIIIGPTFSSVAVEMAELCIERNVLMMTYSATVPSLSLLLDHNLIWRTCPSDFTFGTVAAQYSFNNLEHRKAAILFRDDTWGESLSQIIRTTFSSLDGEVSSYVSYPGTIQDIDTYDFSFELNSVFSEDIDVIFIISFNSEIAKIANEIYNNKLYQDLEDKPQIILSDGIIPEDLMKNITRDLHKSIIGITTTNDGNPNYTTYKENYIERFGFSPATYSEQAYDAVYCISYAMLRANSLDPNNIKTVLREISGGQGNTGGFDFDQVVVNVNEFDIGKNLLSKGTSINYDGASGQISFDIFGDPIPNFVFWGFENGQVVKLPYDRK